MLKNDSGGYSTTFESRRDLSTNATPITKTNSSSVSPEHQQVSVAHFSELSKLFRGRLHYVVTLLYFVS